MPAVPVDSTISARWILPMSEPHTVLENHTVVIRDGRIVDLVPSEVAPLRYAAHEHVDRSAQLLMPGLVNAYAPLGRDRLAGREWPHDAALLRIAAMLKAGTTTFCSVGPTPARAIRAAIEQGMRAMIGLPVVDAPQGAARSDESLTRALALRDEYRGHPAIATAFAPQSVNELSDATFVSIATLADELDAGIICMLHASAEDVARCVEAHGMRPIERLSTLGLLTPALTAVSMVHVSDGDIDLACRGGIALTLCPAADVLSGNPPAPVASWVGTGLRLGLGSGAHGVTSLDLWSALRLLTVLAAQPTARGAALGAWEVLATATRGGAAVLGWDSDIGSLAAGKWADICCIDLAGPAWGAAALASGISVPSRLVHNGGRDLVSDVWVAGRQLVDAGTLTRLDWPALSARTNLRPVGPSEGEP